MTAIVVGGLAYINGVLVDGPVYTVDTDKCGDTTGKPHSCIHDWRIHWGNVDRTGS